MLLHILLLGLLSSQANAEGSCSEWNYDDNTHLGPSSWSTICSTCAASQQSPIDITSGILSTAFDTRLYEPLRITMPQDASGNFTLKNTGHSLQLVLQPPTITVTGAGLPNVYYAAQMHFHWGKDKSVGSEHTVNGKAYPMEAHLVTYNSKYTDFSQATGQPDGVAVFGMFFNELDAGSKNIPYETYINEINLEKVKEPMAQYPVAVHDINYLLPVHRQKYYRYTGSLTTPGCTQEVLWTVFDEPVSLLTSQMSPLRTALNFEIVDGTGGVMVNNYRPVQALNGRKVYVVDPYTLIAVGSSSTPVGSVVSIVALLAIVWQLN